MTLTAHETTDGLGSSKHCWIREKVNRNPWGYLTKSLNMHRTAFLRMYGCGWDRRLVRSGRSSRARSSVTMLERQLGEANWEIKLLFGGLSQEPFLIWMFFYAFFIIQLMQCIYIEDFHILFYLLFFFSYCKSFTSRYFNWCLNCL